MTPYPDSGKDSAEDSRFFKSGNLALSNTELVAVADNPKQLSELCQEVESRVQRQRTESEKPQNKPGTKKWFAGVRTPSDADLLDPKKLREILEELDRKNG